MTGDLRVKKKSYGINKTLIKKVESMNHFQATVKPR